MNAKYYGGWTHEDDMELVEAVLRNVRAGKGVVDGCIEYEEKTNGRRSASANKYRFHTQLKEKYAEAYELARMEGKKVKAEKRKSKPNSLQNAIEVLENPERELTLNDVFVIVNQFKKQQDAKNDEHALSELQDENKLLKGINQRLEGEIKELEITLKHQLEQQKQIMDALKVLEGAGINLNLPKQLPKYAVNKDGTIEKL